MRKSSLVLFTLLSLVFTPSPLTARYQRQDSQSTFHKHEQAVAGSYIVVFKDGVSPAAVEERARDLSGRYGGWLTHIYRHALRGFAVRMNEQAAEALSHHPLVAYVEEDTVVELAATQQGAPWGLDRIDQRDQPPTNTYTYANNGAGVRVYVIDSGIRTTHEEFEGRASVFFDNVGDGRNGQDCFGHGTQEAAIIGGKTYGVAKGAQLLAVRAFGCTNLSTATKIVEAVDKVTELHQKPAVAVMSASGGANLSLDTAVQNSINAGITYVLAAGNNNLDAGTRSPSRVAGALTVGATDVADTRAAFSNYGAVLDLFAPGVDIPTASIFDDRATILKSGTSMAAAHVAGTAARYLSGNSTHSPAQVHGAVVGNATPNKVVNPGDGSPNLLLHAPNVLPVYSYPCAASMATDQEAAGRELQSSYNAWKTTYVTSTAAGGFLRVQRGLYYDRSHPEFDYDTISEGIAYGMILAAYMNDKPTFDGLWQYAKSHFNASQPGHYGFMARHIDRNNNTLDWSAETSADEDMAFALVVADRKWGGYEAEAKALLGKILTHEVEAGTFVLKPSDIWGGSQSTNPSYFAPAFYKVFKTYTGDANWDSVADKTYQIIESVNSKTVAPPNGLQPDWTTATGDPVTNEQGSPALDAYNYGYNAARLPLRLATDKAWHCDPRAASQLDNLNTFFARIGAVNIKDGYKLDGTLLGQWHNAAFVAPAAAGAMVSADSNYRKAMWDETVALRNENYYNDSMRLLSLLLAGGNMTNPLDIPSGSGRKLVLDDFESGTVSKWFVFKDDQTTLTHTAVSPGKLGNYNMNVQYGIASWGGVSQGYTTAQNWSAYQTFDFWFYGSGTGNTIRLEVADNRSSDATDTAERFEYRFVDNVSGWRHVSLPWESFQRRADWQPAGAPNDGFTLSQVWGVSFAPLTGAGSFQLDQVELSMRTYTTLGDFESGDISRWTTFGDAGTTVSVATTAGRVGNYALNVQYAIASWGGVARGYSTPQNWGGQQAFEFWFYGNSTGNTIRLEVADNRPVGSTTDNSERYEYKFKDDSSGWRYMSIPLNSFQRRADWQPDGAPNDGFTLTEVWGFSFAPNTGTSNFKLDQVRLMK